jgi:hypothetical protein
MAKIGEGHAEAMARLGLAELRNAFNPSKEAVSDKDMGLYGVATQGEIADAREATEKPLTMDGLRDDARQKEQERDRGDRGRDEPERGRGR